MAALADAVRAAGRVIFGTGAFTQPQSTAPMAGGGAGVIFSADTARSIIDGLTAGDLYSTQPHLRTVVSFVARNGAQLGRHVYKVTKDGDRERVRDSSLAKVLSHPNEYQTGYDLFNMLFTELALYDMAIWAPSIRDGKWVIDPIPIDWLQGTKAENAFQVASYIIQRPGETPTPIPASSLVVFRGYGPGTFRRGSSAVRSLKGTLSEQVSAMEFREQMWKRGGRVGMFMTRPKDAPEWSAAAKAKFIQDWKSSWSGGGANAGSTPLLEDGIELKRVGFTAKEEQWLEAATLALTTVAGAYHVPPAMVGVSGYNSFASVKEFRKMLYTETLGPSISQVEDTINGFLAPFLGEPEGNYVELNISEKLQGDFEEQAEQLFKAVGGPYMTAAEARAKMNLPFLEGTDVLLAPLNMGATGNNGPAADEPIDQPADPDDAEPDPAKRARGVYVKAPLYSPPDPELDGMTEALKAYYRRQKREVLARSGRKDPEWWDQKRWNQELSSILLPWMTTLSAGVARTAAGAKGLDADAYSVGRTSNFLKAVAESRADLINAGTRDRLKAIAEEAGVDFPSAADRVYDEYVRVRAKEDTNTMATFLTAWAVVEAAKQLTPDRTKATKTWISSGLPKSRHSRLNGETVPIDQPFSNGADWPGDPVLGAGQVANCGCGVDINY